MAWEISGKVTGVPPGTEFLDLDRVHYSSNPYPGTSLELTMDGNGDFPFTFTASGSVTAADECWMHFVCVGGAAQNYPCLGSMTVGPYLVGDIGVEV